MTYGRATIMRDARKRFRDGQRLGLGWIFGRRLSTACLTAKLRRPFEEQRARFAA